MNPEENVVAMTALHDELSDIMDRVFQGETITVTRYGKPRAVINPVGADEPADIPEKEEAPDA